MAPTQYIGRKPRILACVVLCAYFVVSTLAHIGTGQQLGFADEAATAGLILVALVLCRIPSSAAKILAVAFFLFAWGAISNWFNPLLFGAPRLQLIISGGLIDLKPYLLAFAFLVILRNASHYEQTQLVRFVCLAFILLASLNFIFLLLDIFRGVDIRGRTLMTRAGFIVPQGIYEHKYMGAATSLIGFICALSQRKALGNLYRPVIVAMALGILVTLSAKEILAATLVLVLHNANGHGGWRVMGLIATIVVTLVVVSTNNPVSVAISERFTTFSSLWSETMRGALYGTAPVVATDFFPFGTGWGTFGSSPSRDIFYSPVYVAYGINNVWGGSPTHGVFLIDTFWPKIIAEQGWIGFVVYAWLWVRCGKTALGLAFTEDRSSNQNFAFYSYVALLLVSLMTPIYNYADAAIITGLAFALLLPMKVKATSSAKVAVSSRAAPFKERAFE